MTQHRRHAVDSCSNMKKSYATWSKSWQESRWCLAGLRTWGIEQCRESCPTSVHRQVRAHELRLHLNLKIHLESAGRITRQERVKTPVNMYDTEDGGCAWNRLDEFTDRSHRTEGDHRNCSCRRKKMWSTGDLQLPRAKRPATGRRGIFSLDEAQG